MRYIYWGINILCIRKGIKVERISIMNNEIKEKVIEEFINCVNPSLDTAEVESCEKLEELGLDSLNFIKLVMLLEEEYGVEFDPMATPEEFEELEKIVRYIEENM